MKNVKLLLKSLFNNNVAIDGARKKPWYFAIIIFFFSIVLSVIPGTVQQLKQHGDKKFDNTTFLAREATTEFAKELQDNAKYGELMYVVKEDKKNSHLVANESVNFERTNAQTGAVDYVFCYVEDMNLTTALETLKTREVSFFVFTKNDLYIRIVNPQDHSSAVIEMYCLNAYKKVSENAIKESYIESESPTETANKTWDNWKTLIRNFYNQTRLKSAGTQLIILSSVNAAIALIMGFMVWILTRGKNNPYRLFTFWDGCKISCWCMLCPALLTTGLGFLISSFATTMFPLLLGVRVMWLSMKSLRPDGTGYAAE